MINITCLLLSSVLPQFTNSNQLNESNITLFGVVKPQPYKTVVRTCKKLRPRVIKMTRYINTHTSRLVDF